MKTLITSITIPVNVIIPDDTTMGKYESSFKSYYENNEKLAGIYVYDSGTWTKQ